jgi:hypothetical protein
MNTILLAIALTTQTPHEIIVDRAMRKAEARIARLEARRNSAIFAFPVIPVVPCYHGYTIVIPPGVSVRQTR